MNIDTKQLYPKIGYVFKDADLLKAALSHRSVRGKNNERLEFLGDSILNCLITIELYQRNPDATEGELSRLRAHLVREETLAELAQKFELGTYLYLGAGELKSGGFRRHSILADAFEAIIGAIYLDAGIETCKSCILSWYAERLNNLSEITTEKDPKTRLQEYLQAHRLSLPTYIVLSASGEPHQQTFHVECKVAGIAHVTQAAGTSRRRAEQEAAQKFLAWLGHE